MLCYYAVFDRVGCYVIFYIIIDFRYSCVTVSFTTLVIALSLSITRWPLKMSDHSLVARRVFCDVNGGNRIQTGFP